MSAFRDVRKGPGDLPGDNTNPNSPDYDHEADEARDEAIDALLSNSSWRAAHAAEADEWCDGTFDGEHYSAVERALADLAEVPADRLIGSDALATVLRLADVHAAERNKKLREMAKAEFDARRNAA